MLARRLRVAFSTKLRLWNAVVALLYCRPDRESEKAGRTLDERKDGCDQVEAGLEIGTRAEEVDETKDRKFGAWRSAVALSEVGTAIRCITVMSVLKLKFDLTVVAAHRKEEPRICHGWGWRLQSISTISTR